jgi:hypothetical protein
MSFRVFRKVVIALLVSTTLAGAAPSQATWLRPHRKLEEPARNGASRGLVASLLLYLLECAGGAMDPNGSH